MSELWSVPGYGVPSPSGPDGADGLWRAPDLATGEAVLLHRRAAPTDPAEADALRRRLSLVTALDTSHVLGLRAVVEDGPHVVLVLDPAPGGSLAALLARRRSLEPGEVVTVAAPLAAALAAAHAVGLGHGRLTPAHVLFTADGMPLLWGLAVEPVDVDPSADVRALAAVCRRMLGGTADEPLAVGAPGVEAALATAVEQAADPAQRSGAADFAARLRRSCPAVPVRRRAAPDERRPRAAADPSRAGRHVAPGRSRRRPSSGTVAAAAVVLLVVAAAVGGWLWGRGGDAVVGRAAAPPALGVPPATSARPSPAATAAVLPSRPDPSAAAPDWVGVLDALDAARAVAFARADAEVLTAAYAPGSPGLAADGQLVRRLAAAGQTASGVRHAVQSVQVLQATSDRARLRVVDVLAAHEVRDARGTVVLRTPARGQAAHLVELVRTPAGWRLVEVRPT